MDVKNELEKLNSGIYLPMVFYIPYALFPDLSEDQIQKLEEVQFFNTMGILNTKSETKTLHNSISSIEILKKSKILKSNFIQLVEFENQLSKEAFFHLINEYFNFANAYNYIFRWMVNHIDNDIPNAKSEYKYYFIYQEKVLNQHILELNGRFQIYNTPLDTSESFNKIFENGKNLLPINNDLKTSLIQNINAPQKPLNTKSKKKGKLVLPSDAEVDNMLLESIFNVNISEAK